MDLSGWIFFIKQKTAYELRISDWSSDVCSSELDLAGEPDALALPARQGAAGAIEIEVVEPDIVEEAQPLIDLLEDGMGDLLLLAGELALQRAEPREGIGDREPRGTGDVDAGDLDGERLGLAALAVAGFARLRGLAIGPLLAQIRRASGWESVGHVRT